MYPSQMHYQKSNVIHEVQQSATEILRLSREIVGNGHMERKFIVFPLFMAGYVEKRAAERAEILTLMRKLEEDSIGRNFVATRQLLEILYDRQERRQQTFGASLGIRQLAGERRQSTGDHAAEGHDRGWRGQGAVEVPEDVDWVGLISELGLQVVNCRI